MRPVRFGLLLVVTQLVVAFAPGCKKSEETVAPAAVDAGTPAATTPPADTAAATPPPQTPPPPPATPVPGAKPGASAKPDAGAAAAPDAGAASSGGAAGGGNKFQNCVQKCGASMQACLTPQAGPDGGPPRFGDPTTCNKVAEACRAACTQ